MKVWGQSILDFGFWINPIPSMLGQEVRNERILDFGKVPQINLGADRILDARILDW
jgi:hypothetical protein